VLGGGDQNRAADDHASSDSVQVRRDCRRARPAALARGLTGGGFLRHDTHLRRRRPHSKNPSSRSLRTRPRANRGRLCAAGSARIHFADVRIQSDRARITTVGAQVLSADVRIATAGAQIPSADVRAQCVPDRARRDAFTYPGEHERARISALARSLPLLELPEQDAGCARTVKRSRIAGAVPRPPPDPTRRGLYGREDS
jgi:hypothetical protein